MRAAGRVKVGCEGARHTDNVPVQEVVALQLVAGLLGVHQVIIDDKGGALGGVVDAQAHLAVSQTDDHGKHMSSQMRSVVMVAGTEGLTGWAQTGQRDQRVLL